MSGRPGAVPGAGAEHIHPASEPKASLSSIGGAAPVPPPSLAFALAALRFPRAASGGCSRFMPFVRCGRQGPVAALPPRCAGPPLAPWLSSGRRAFAPSGAGAGGAGFWGSLPSLSPAPGGRCRRSRRRWVAGFLVRWLFWGCVVVRSLSVPVASSVVLSARCGLAPWAGSALGVSFRPSSVALLGFVAVVRFSSSVAAGAFARSWSCRLPVACCGCRVRAVPVVAGVAPSWVVSVPVAPPPVPVRRGGASRRLAAVFAARCSVAA